MGHQILRTQNFLKWRGANPAPDAAGGSVVAIPSPTRLGHAGGPCQADHAGEADRAGGQGALTQGGPTDRGGRSRRLGPRRVVGALDVGQPPAEQVGDLRRGREPVGGVLGVEPGDDRGEPVGDFRVELAERRGDSSQTRRSTAIVDDPRNGGRPQAMA